MFVRRFAATLLLLASASALPVQFALQEPGCTPVSAEVLSAFATNAGAGGSVTGWEAMRPSLNGQGGGGGSTAAVDHSCWPPLQLSAAARRLSLSCVLAQRLSPPLPSPVACADGKNSVTRAQAADIACHLKPLLDRAAANDADADATLTAVYQAWRQAFRPQVDREDGREDEWWAVSGRAGEACTHLSSAATAAPHAHLLHEHPSHTPAAVLGWQADGLEGQLDGQPGDNRDHQLQPRFALLGESCSWAGQGDEVYLCCLRACSSARPPVCLPWCAFH